MNVLRSPQIHAGKGRGERDRDPLFGRKLTQHGRNVYARGLHFSADRVLGAAPPQSHFPGVYMLSPAFVFECALAQSRAELARWDAKRFRQGPRSNTSPAPADCRTLSR
jgi:hypothetical protein